MNESKNGGDIPAGEQLPDGTRGDIRDEETLEDTRSNDTAPEEVRPVAAVVGGEVGNEGTMIGGLDKSDDADDPAVEAGVEDDVDEEMIETFPASDPPANY